MPQPNKINKKVHNKVPIVFTWDRAIADTEKQLRETRDRMRKLRAAISVFKEKKAQNAPVPGSKVIEALK